MIWNKIYNKIKDKYHRGNTNVVILHIGKWRKNNCFKRIRKYLQKDYDCIDKLFEMNLISKEKYDSLLE